MLVSLNEAHSVCQWGKRKGVCVYLCVYLHILQYNSRLCFFCQCTVLTHILICSERVLCVGTCCAESGRALRMAPYAKKNPHKAS